MYGSDVTPENYSHANEARILKVELDEIAVRKTRGVIIRSRARCYELQSWTKVLWKNLHLWGFFTSAKQTVTREFT